MKRELVQLADTYVNQDVTGWWLSEKYDGMRAIWDGGITRDMPKSDVPWANLNERPDQRCTGLWSRNGNVIVAPWWWTESLPNFALDGELWIGRSVAHRQKLMTIVKPLEPTAEWEDVRYVPFDAPPIRFVFRDGLVDTPFYTREITGADEFIMAHAQVIVDETAGYVDRYRMIKSLPFCVQQCVIEDVRDIDAKLEELLAIGAEGIILRNPYARYATYRTKLMLKHKPWHDDEAVVIGYRAGKGRLTGQLGALIVQNGTHEFEIGGGFTDAERYLTTDVHEAPGAVIRDCGSRFAIGDLITYKYRRLSADGTPLEAHYWRKRDGE